MFAPAIRRANRGSAEQRSQAVEAGPDPAEQFRRAQDEGGGQRRIDQDSRIQAPQDIGDATWKVV